MLVVVLVISILTFCNTLLQGLILCAIYGKCSDIVEKLETK